MSDARPPLCLDQGISVSPDHSAGTATTISLIGERKRFSLRFKEQNFEAVKNVTNIDLPPQIGGTSKSNGLLCFCLGPDEWMILCDGVDLPAKFLSAPQPYSLVDVSHRNVALEVCGEGSVAMLNIGCPLDLSLNSFPVGKVSRTIFERAEVILYRISESCFHVEMWRSFAPYVLRILEKSS